MPDTVAKLKELLFDNEAATLSDLRNRIDLVAEAERRGFADLAARLQRLDEAHRQAAAEMAVRLEPTIRRAGTAEAIRASIAEVLDDAIVDARETKHEAMTRAIAPLVVRTIKTELRNSQDEMVEALYPITGRLVKSYVASAMKDMMNQINRRLEMNPTMLRFRSLMSGYSMAELALADSQRLEIDELYLIRRGSGALIQRWPASPARSNSDIQLSSVIAAINDFSGHAFQDDGGNLRSFNLDDFTVFLRASPVYLLAAKCRGTAVRGVEGAIDAEFVDIVTRQHALEIADPEQNSGTTVPSNLLADLRDRLETGIEDKHARLARAGMPFHPLKALVALLVLTALAGGCWLAWTSYEASVARAKAREVIEQTATLKGFPIDLDVGWRGQSLAVSGFAPSLTAKSQLARQLKDALPETEISVERMAVLSSGPDLSPQLAEVRRDLSGLGAEVATSSLRRSLDRAIGRLEQTRPELMRLAEQTEAASRSVATRATATLDEVLRDLTVQRRTIVGAGHDLSRLTGMQTELAAVASRLQRVGSDLAVLLGGNVASSASGSSSASSSSNVAAKAAAIVNTPPPADTPEAVENVGIAAERVATIATAAVQASSIRVPPPVVTQVVGQPSPRDRLQAFVRSTAIFFADGEAFRAPDKANAAIDELARLMTAATGLVRIVGYTDERGGSNRNLPLSQTRADRVAQALIARGVPRERLSAIGRANTVDLSLSVGPNSPNRRVEFELGFDDETTAGP